MPQWSAYLLLLVPLLDASLGWAEPIAERGDVPATSPDAASANADAPATSSDAAAANADMSAASADVPSASSASSVASIASVASPGASTAEREVHLVGHVAIDRSRDEQTPIAPAIVETLSLLVIMRSTEAYLWPNPFSFNQIEQWPHRYAQAFTMPPKFDSSRAFMQWDGDRWGINVVGHGLFGSELYMRPRRCGFGWFTAFGYAAVASALWEYGFEANGVRPSGVDLWYTPLSGIVLGEVRFQAWRAFGGVSNRGIRAMLRGIIDPVGEFSTGVVGAPC